MTPRKICMVTTVHRPDDVRIYYKEALSLRAAGFPVAVVGPGPSRTDAQGVEFFRIGLPANRFLRMLGAGPAAFWGLLRADGAAFHLHDPELLPLGLALRMLGRPVIYDAHENLPLQLLSKPWLPAWGRRPLAAAARAAEGWMGAQMSLVVAATEEIAARFPRAITVRNLPGPGEVSALLAPGPARREAALCYIGALSAGRGAWQMIRSARLAGVRLYLAGTPEGEPLCRYLLQCRDGRGLVRYLGQLDRAQVAALLRRVQGGLLTLQPTPAYRQSLPIKLFEYQLAGLPVIASDFPYWRQHRAFSQAIFVPPGDLLALSRAMRQLIDHPEEARRRGQAGRQLVEREFLFGPEAGRLCAAYHHLFGEDRL